MKTRHTLRILLAASTVLTVPSIASAQEAVPSVDSREAVTPAPQAPDQQSAPAEESGALGDIVVTAQRRETKLQDTAIAITAVGGADLRSREINTIENLAPSLPNVNFGKNVGFARIAIRGVGLDTTVAGQEGRVAYHLDGVYISRPSAAISSFFDVNRVEVVRGPQGTLYGRNATAGAVNVLTNDPEREFGGYLRATFGNYSTVNTEGAITGAVSDTLSARFAFQTNNRDGFGQGLVTGEELDDERSFGVRAKVKWEPSAAFDITVSADYFHENDNAFVYHYLGEGSPNVRSFGIRLGGRVAENPRDSFGEVPQTNIRTFYGFGAVANLDLGFGTLTSVTGYRRGLTDYRSDLDGTDVNITNFRIVENSTQLSQELRLAGEAGPVRYLVGAYYFDEAIYGNVGFTPLRQLSGRPPLAQGVDYRGDLDTKAYAAFGQLDWEIVSGLTLSVGARYSYEEKRIDHVGVVDLVTPFDPTVPLVFRLFQADSVDFDSFTPRLSVEYRATPDILLYATYAKGFKSGGFSLNAFNPALEPEELTDYEGGIKSEFFDDRLRINLAAFYYDYTNLQVQRITGAVAEPINAASATVKGLEAEIATRPFDGFELSGNFALLDAQFEEFATADAARANLGVLDLSGNRLQQAPKYTFNVSAAYTLPTSIGEFTLRGEAIGTDRVFFSPYNRREVSQAAYTKFNAFLNYKSDTSGLTGSLFVRNIANKRTISSAQVSAGFAGFPIVGAFDPPRTYGLSLGINF